MTPTGAPAWVKANDHATYGGDVNKTNYQSQGAINALTDVTAAQFCRLAADVAACHNTSEFATLRYLCNDGGGGAAPTLQAYDSQPGPSLVPTGTRNGNGDVTYRWAPTYADPYAIAGAIHLSHAVAQLHGATSGACTVELLDQDADGKNESVRVRSTDLAGVALVSPVLTLTVWTGQV